MWLYLFDVCISVLRLYWLALTADMMERGDNKKNLKTISAIGSRLKVCLSVCFEGLFLRTFFWALMFPLTSRHAPTPPQCGAPLLVFHILPSAHWYQRVRNLLRRAVSRSLILFQFAPCVTSRHLKYLKLCKGIWRDEKRTRTLSHPLLWHGLTGGLAKQAHLWNCEDTRREAGKEGLKCDAQCTMHRHRIHLRTLKKQETGNTLRVSAVDMQWRISVVWQERWKAHYKALREEKKKKAEEECDMLHALECAMLTSGSIYRRENAQRLKKLKKLKRTWKQAFRKLKFFDCGFCSWTWWNWHHLSERNDVRKALKAPKALKGRKRQERLGANCNAMMRKSIVDICWHRSEKPFPMSGLLPRQENSGSAFLESRKHLQRLMPDSHI